ncbi:nucleoside phosphorylase domain-containing protein [Aspergillus californicus]
MSEPTALENAELYTIGWIAALPVELAAAEAMLDEEHGKPISFIQPPQDPNIYTWGRIADHNIVITSLPGRLYGAGPAAITASRMLSSFPNIRFGLLVGIGGGIPRLDTGRDIRLGDIAVSEPHGTNGGVIQYDSFKAAPNGQPQSRAFLNMPPEILLRALTKIQAHHERFSSKVPEFLAQMVKDYPKMGGIRNGYVHQGFDNDRLFSDTDSSQEIERDRRDTTDPEIHYGTIASGNTLFKDGVYRKILDDLGEECICFETEAAGLMNTFPCIVIRGISHYADSFKNDRWKRYAAATAAAYAKELLIHVPSQELRGQQRTIDIKEISDHLNMISFQMDSNNADIRAYIQEQIRTDHAFKRWESRFSGPAEIENEMMSKLNEIRFC